MTLEELYKKLDNSWQVLCLERKNYYVDTADMDDPNAPKTVAEKVNALKDQMNELRVNRSHTDDNSIRRAEYDRNLEGHEVAIDHLEGLVKDLLQGHLIDGTYVGMGYAIRKGKPPKLTVIPKSEWVILELNHKDSIAISDEIEYRQIRITFSKRYQKVIDQDTEIDQGISLSKQSSVEAALPKKRLSTIAIEAAAEELLIRNGKFPQYMEVIHYLKKEDKTCTIYVKDGSLKWTDQNGKEHNLSSKAIQNTLTRIKKSLLSK